MIGTTILTLVVFSLLYPVLTREKLTRGKIIWLNRQQIRKKHLKQWKPINEDSELIIKDSKISMKGGWRNKPKLRYKLRDKKVKVIGRACVSLIIMISIYSIFHIPVPFLFGVVNTWAFGGINNLWSTAGNWDQGHKPAIGEDVVINQNGVNKCIMDENSADALVAFTILGGGEFENGSYTIYFTASFTSNLGIYTKDTGTLHLKGGASQTITSGGNAFYHVVVTGANTIYYTKDDTEIFDLDVQAGATFEVDAVSEGAALTISYSDIAGAGFANVATFDGTLLCQGDVTNGVTITSAGAPPTNFWNGFPGSGSNYESILSFTTIEYHTRLFGLRAKLNNGQTWTNVTIRNAETDRVVVTEDSAVTWTNVSVDGGGSLNCVTFVANPTNIDNLVITNSGTFDIMVSDSVGSGSKNVEMTNSNFNAAKVSLLGTGDTSTLVSDNHNDVAGDWVFWGGISSSRNKSSITNDFVATDNVTIYTGKLIADEAAAHNDLIIKTGGELEVDGGITETVTNTGTITIESGGILDWTGSLGSMITLRSDVPGTQWSLNVNPGGIYQVDYVDVQDCDASGGRPIDATNGHSVGKHENNANWLWPKQNSYILGFTSMHTPKG